ncbi:MAG: type II toxin-antitoxin system VapC family toxin [Pirellulaceae bacterium]
MVFVDTGAWFAWFVSDDPNHGRVATWFATNSEPYLTTDYCIDETLTLLVARGRIPRSRDVGFAFFHENLSRIHFLTPNQIHRAWILFRQRAAPGWSFTDCTSKIVIDDLQISTRFRWTRTFSSSGM